MPRHRRGDRFALGGERRADDAGAGSGPRRRLAAEQTHAQRGRDGRVADPHLADRQRVDPRLDRHHAVGNGAGAFLFAHRRRLDDVGGRRFEVHLVDPQVGIDHPAQLVHRGAAGDEVLHHLRRDRGRIGRDAARRDAVIGGENDGAGMVEARRVPTLPGREPGRQLFEPAERAGRLGQLAFAGRRGGAGIEIGSRQMGQQGADLIQLRHCLGHRRSCA